LAWFPHPPGLALRPPVFRIREPGVNLGAAPCHPARGNANAGRKQPAALHSAARRIASQRDLFNFVAKAKLGLILRHAHAPSFANGTIPVRRNAGPLNITKPATAISEPLRQLNQWIWTKTYGSAQTPPASRGFVGSRDLSQGFPPPKPNQESPIDCQSERLSSRYTSRSQLVRHLDPKEANQSPRHP
jgi:hypothetical protein